MEALNIAKPFDSICSASSREGMPAKVRMALRTLLFSTSAVLVDTLDGWLDLAAAAQVLTAPRVE